MDIRVVKTRKAITDAFLAFRARKGIEKITVKELCEKAQVNKSTFYKHFRDVYDLSEYLEGWAAEEIISSIRHPEDLLSRPDVFTRELFYACIGQTGLIHTLFSGSRASMLPVRIEERLREIIFNLRPDYREDPMVNMILTMEIYGCFYAFEKYRHFGDDVCIGVLSKISRKIMELLEA